MLPCSPVTGKWYINSGYITAGYYKKMNLDLKKSYFQVIGPGLIPNNHY
jgi:hypothetical protein